MHITLNGKEHQLNAATTIADLLGELNLPHAGLAVAVNEEIVMRDDHASHQLNAGDRVEIIRAIGGG